MDNNEDLIKMKIKGREVIYYLTTLEDLNEIKSKGILGDIFILFFSISIGGIISILITKATSSLPSQSINILSILLYVFLSSTIIFGLLSAYFYISSYKIIKRIKGSGEIKSITTPEKLISGGFEIINAIYESSNKSFNVTDKLRQKIKDGKLSTKADNDIAGDPEDGVAKILKIKYSINGTIFQREYTENSIVDLP